MGKLEKRPTQCQKILDYIRRFGKITSWEAYSELGITQLGARIYNLKQQGYIFSTTRVTTTNRLGEKTHYDEYRLVEADK
jgi:hypothetical protein